MSTSKGIKLTVPKGVKLTATKGVKLTVAKGVRLTVPKQVYLVSIRVGPSLACQGKKLIVSRRPASHF